MILFLDFIGFGGQMDGMKVTPTERLRRMRRMFAKAGGILLEDYEHFTGVSIRQNTGPHKLGKPHGQPALAPS